MGVTTGTKLFVGLVGFSGGVVGFVWGYPAGTASEALGYYGNKKNIMSIEKKSDQNQWFKYNALNVDVIERDDSYRQRLLMSKLAGESIEFFEPVKIINDDKNL